MRGVKAVLSGTGLISGVGGVAALTALNRAPAASVLEVLEEEPKFPVEEKQEEVMEETAPIMDVYVVGYQSVTGDRKPIVNEISPDKLTDGFISLDGEAKNCSMRGNDQGRSYVYWHPKQKKLVCHNSFQWRDWFAVAGVKKNESLGEVKLSDEMEKSRNLRKAMSIFKEEGHDDDTFKEGCKAFYDLTFKDGLSSHFCISLLY